VHTDEPSSSADIGEKSLLLRLVQGKLACGEEDYRVVVLETVAIDGLGIAGDGNVEYARLGSDPLEDGFGVREYRVGEAR
jgi:hypothetical protein